VNIEVCKQKVASRRCQKKIVEPEPNWRETRQCNNRAKFVVNDVCMCRLHASKAVFDQYLLEYPPI